MQTGSLTIEELVEAFVSLGGEADWGDVQTTILAERGNSTAPYKDKVNFDTTLWQVLYRHCPGFAKYTGNAVFQRTGNSRYRLLDFDPRDAELQGAKASELNDWEASVRRSRETSEFNRDAKLASEIKKLYGSQCQRCGTKILLPSGDAYAEAHHIRGLSDGGPDVLSNMLCLCANCHALLDLKAVRIDSLMLKSVAGHKPEQQFVDHHNALHQRRWGLAS